MTTMTMANLYTNKQHTHALLFFSNIQVQCNRPLWPMKLRVPMVGNFSRASSPHRERKTRKTTKKKVSKYFLTGVSVWDSHTDGTMKKSRSGAIQFPAQTTTQSDDFLLLPQTTDGRMETRKRKELILPSQSSSSSPAPFNLMCRSKAKAEGALRQLLHKSRPRRRTDSLNWMYPASFFLSFSHCPTFYPLLSFTFSSRPSVFLSTTKEKRRSGASATARTASNTRRQMDDVPASIRSIPRPAAPALLLFSSRDDQSQTYPIPLLFQKKKKQGNMCCSLRFSFKSISLRLIAKRTCCPPSNLIAENDSIQFYFFLVWTASKPISLFVHEMNFY